VVAIDRYVLVAVNGTGRVEALDTDGRRLTSVRVGPGPHGIAVVRNR